jgi:uncharacterized PurR-regulated membrane protein YhhQ (DUF165 family)
VTDRSALAAAGVYLATIPLANWFIGHVGTQEFPGGPHVIPVGFGYTAPSGVLLIGLALAMRDAVQRLAGRWLVLAAIAIGVALSYWVNPAIATASAVAFGIGELADFSVFTPLSRRHLVAAVVISGIIGGIVDTFLFLQIAFGSTDYWQGQVIGKTFMAAAAGIAIYGIRRRTPAIGQV